MLHFFSDILDQQIRMLETQGIKILFHILGFEAYLFAWFADASGISAAADVVKNILLSLIGIAMGIMGVVNTYIGMRRRIKKYLEEDKKDTKDKAA